MILNIHFPLYLGFLLLLTACNSGPKVVEASNDDPAPSASGIFSDEAPQVVPIETHSSSAFSEELHTVIVDEVLPASRYVYLYVHENDEHFWIATRKQEVTIGESYFYTSGLLKTQFESKEFNRVFDKIYLVSKLVPEKHGMHSQEDRVAPSSSPATTARELGTSSKEPVKVAGSLSIAELVKDPEKYAGQSIQVSGTCVKVNPNIMNRNWIHLQDGTADAYDLVITSDQLIHEGAVVTMEATVAVNRDFGAGYSYELILENGLVIP